MMESDHSTSQSVLMEAALSKSISHPNVVATYNCDLKPVPVSEEQALVLIIKANV